MPGHRPPRKLVSLLTAAATAAALIVATPAVASTTARTAAAAEGDSKVASIPLPERGWFSGASGDGVDFGKTAFGEWRGDAVDSMATWIDAPDGGLWNCNCNVVDGVGSAAGFRGLVDIALGGPTDYSATASGSLDDSFRGMLTRLKQNRTIDGVLYPTVLRPSHEANGSWYAWSVSAGEVGDYRATMKRWRGIVDEVYPEALFAFGMNGETTSDVKVSDMYEDGVWDLIGSDRYNQFPYIGTNYAGQFTSWEDASTRGSDDNPIGAETWRQFAENRGLPLYFPEWGNNGRGSDQSGDDPYYIEQFYGWLRGHTGNGAGEVFAEMYFNICCTEEDKWPVFYDDGRAVAHPGVSQAYAEQFPAPGTQPAEPPVDAEEPPTEPVDPPTEPTEPPTDTEEPPTEETPGTPPTSGFDASARYLVSEVGTGQCIDASGVSGTNGTSLILYECHGNDNQSWQFVPTTDGYYRLSAGHAPDSGWDVAGWSFDSGADVVLWDFNDTSASQNQQWKVIAESDGTYRFQSRHSNQCLDASEWWGMQQSSCEADDAATRFELTAIG